MAPNLINIQPAGQVLSRPVLMDDICAGHGSNPDFRISMSDVAVRWAAKHCALVTYIEIQEGALQTVPSDNRRISSVLFDISGEQPVWLHNYETVLDDKRLD